MKSQIAAASLLTVLVAAVPITTRADTGVSAVYNVPAGKLWQTIDFHQPSENVMPPVASSTREGRGLGATKVNVLKGGGEVHLLLVYYEPAERAFNYTIQSSPLPVKNYVGEVRVKKLGSKRSRLTWHGTYDPDGVSEDKADEILGGFYQAIFKRVGEMHEMQGMEMMDE
ncbi:MAG: SRPBCC family protein [Halofilum sp. (in: g-proteobacteria)]|nr:SRPBCC family protein [Halofilum sp. (in: g-proteobacteria)]